MNKEFISKSTEETLKFAKDLSKKILKSGLKIAIDGDLGAGKTLFAKGFFESYLDEDEYVKSPSFTIMNEYIDTNDNSFFHLDLYRVLNTDELYGTGFFDVIQDENSIMYIEWYKNIDISEYYNKNWIFIRIDIIDNDKRKITIKNFTQ